MQKVMIADDEEKICQLIEKLVDWDKMDMKIVAVAHNGLEAYEKIKEFQPDIVITDIRMPGMDGLEMIRESKKLDSCIEFIIISGYRHFEYARSAIKYGVSDYLLKPIKKEELNATLSKMREEYLQRTEQLTFEERILLSRKNDVERVRTGFFSGILYPKERGQKMPDLEEVNRDYHFQFGKGIFQMVSIKLDGVGEVPNRNLQFLMEKLQSSVESSLRPCCYDLELYFENSRSYCLLNYLEEQKKTVRKGLKTVLDDLILQESILQGLHVTIGCGSMVGSLEEGWDSMQLAVRGVEQRLIAGTDRVIEGAESVSSGETSEMGHGKERPRKSLADTPLFHEFNQNMNQALELLDIEMVSEELDRLEQGLMGMEGITGHDILQMTKEACNIYLFYMRSHQFTVKGGDYFLENFNVQSNGFYQVRDLFAYLKQAVLTSLAAAAQEKQQEDHKPIRTAKQYIQEHFNRPLTLEEVSEVAGFNATYFSSLFKKETGSSFLEYLSEVRMNQARKLLRETNESVAVICEKVGYSDVKYFTKSFIKFSGLKPNEYRKLYS